MAAPALSIVVFETESLKNMTDWSDLIPHSLRRLIVRFTRALLLPEVRRRMALNFSGICSRPTSLMIIMVPGLIGSDSGVEGAGAEIWSAWGVSVADAAMANRRADRRRAGQVGN